jgi:hypothetical protein
MYVQVHDNEADVFSCFMMGKANWWPIWGFTLHKTYYMFILYQETLSWSWHPLTSMLEEAGSQISQVAQT